MQHQNPFRRSGAIEACRLQCALINQRGARNSLSCFVLFLAWPAVSGQTLRMSIECTEKAASDSRSLVRLETHRALLSMKIDPGWTFRARLSLALPRSRVASLSKAKRIWHAPHDWLKVVSKPPMASTCLASQVAMCFRPADATVV